MRRIVLLICLLLLLPSPLIAQQSTLLFDELEWLRSDEVQRLACPFRDRISYEHGEIECGLIEVPENREMAGSRSIELHYVRIAATGDEEDYRDDPVIYLTGGPGGEVAGYVSRLREHGILDRRDMYILEQRGIGTSGDFCPLFGDRNPGNRVRDSYRGQQEAFMEAVADCMLKARARGVDIRGYNSIENARDVRALRMALGYENWNVWGISYGSMLGQALLNIDPEGTRAMVLDAIVPLDLTDLMRLPHWYARDLAMLFEACEEQSRCARGYAGLHERFLAAIRTLREDPVHIELPVGDRFPDGEAWVFQDLVAGLPFSLLYEQSNHPILPALMTRLSRAVEERDKDFFRAINLADTSGGFGSSTGMGIAVRCLDHYIDEQARHYPGEVEANPELALAFGHPEVTPRGPKVCRELGLTPRDRAQYRQPESDLPIIVANGAWDPITPPPLARYILEGLDNARYLEFPHAGHGPTRSVDCAGELMNDFFDDPSAQLDEDCVADGESAARYLTSVYETRAPIRGILLMEADSDAMGGQIAWAGVSLLLVGGGFAGLGLGWLGARINGSYWSSSHGGRLMIFLSGLLILLWLTGMALAAHFSNELSPALLLVGFVGWAGWVAWLAPLAILLAIAGAVQLYRYHPKVSRAGLIGMALLVLGVISLSLFGLYWDLWPL